MEAERRAMEQSGAHNSTSQHGDQVRSCNLVWVNTLIREITLLQQVPPNTQSQTSYLKLKEEPKYDPNSYCEI